MCVVSWDVLADGKNCTPGMKGTVDEPFGAPKAHYGDAQHHRGS
jgi:hypothetical protein